MPTAENAKLQYESGQTSYPMEELTDSGDAKTFDSQAVLFSGADGKEPDVKPDGIATGGGVIPAVSGTDNLVDVAALSCYQAGVKIAVSAGIDEAIVRAATDVASITSITINSSGAITMVQGTDSADTSFSETRGAAGGPPLIPVGSIEKAQVRTASNVAAAITEAEIFQVIGLHQERYNSPGWDVDSKNAQVAMKSSLPLIHVGALPKAVNASYADPIFADVPKSTDYKPSAISKSVSSEQIYSDTIGSSSSSLNGGSFKTFLEDGITDPIVQSEGDTLWFRFYPNQYKAPYMLDQGTLNFDTEFPASGPIAASCTIAPSSAAARVEA